MSGPVFQTEAHVLAKVPHAGDRWLLTLFCPSEGPLQALLRVSRSGRVVGAAAEPDLFDRLAVALERGRVSLVGGLWFVREHRVLVRREGIGRGYASLAAASRLARIAACNPAPAEGRAAVDVLLGRAFDALARADARPSLVYFKCLYLLARDEGLPVRQDWAAALSAGDRELAGAILARPVDAPDAPGEADVGRLTRRLEAWLVGEHEMRID